MTSTDNQPCREALLPCPFCGSSDNWYPFEAKMPYSVRCGRCDTRSGYANTKELAIWLWNIRTPPISYEAAVEEVAVQIQREFNTKVVATEGYDSYKAEMRKSMAVTLAKAALAAMGISEGKDGL